MQLVLREYSRADLRDACCGGDRVGRAFAVAGEQVDVDSPCPKGAHRFQRIVADVIG